MEKCWKIEEVRPIKVNIVNRWNKYRIVVPAGVMKYDTWEHLFHNHCMPTPWGTNYSSAPTIGVSGSSYDYTDGECEFDADSLEEVNKWIEEYKEIVELG